ncbi:MAG TPA: disulfide bond formation protein B [Gaiellaceae bacterium]|nr:disulfide bond formation protein B [Gaiellaceae bacterium]
MTHDVVVLIAALGVAGQALVVLGVLLALVALGRLRSWLWGYELWAAFLVAAIATGGSLFFSQVANFVPCELCWFQRICMYPLSLLLLFLAWHRDNRAARYLLAFPVVGACISVYHLLVENKVVGQTSACLVSAPGGCATKWIDEFGYMTIPTLALTGFVLLIGFLVLAVAGADDADTLPADAER